MELIDRKPLLEKWKKDCTDGECFGDCFDCQFPVAIEELENAPTIDAVPVVRCGECKKRYTLNCPLMYGGITSRRGNGEWFCADGERRER